MLNKNKIYFTFFISLIYILYFSQVFCQSEIKFSRLSLEHGLSQNCGRCILQDKEGFLWIGTEDGLNKFNGYEFTVYQKVQRDSQSLCNNFINTIFESNDGIIWVGTNDGLAQYNKLTDKFTIYKNEPNNSKSISNNAINSINEDKAGNLWIGTNNGLVKFDKKTQTFSSYFNSAIESGKLSENIVNVIFEAQDEILWLGTNNGLNKFDRKTEKLTVYKNEPTDINSISSNVIRSIYEDSEGYLWLGTFGGGINKFDRKSNTFVAFKNAPENPQSISNNNVYSIAEDNQNKLLFATDLGLNIFNKSTNSFVSYQYQPFNNQSISRNEIMSVYKDKVGRIWVGTWGGGINLLNDKSKFKNFNNNLQHSKALSSNRIRSILQDKNGYIWIGTDEGINKYDKKTNTFISYKNEPTKTNSLSSNKITPLYEDKSGVLWIGSFDGLNKMLKEGDFVTYKNNKEDLYSLAFNKVRCIHEDSQGNFWIGTWGGRGGLNLLNRETGKFTIYKHNSNDNQSLSNDEIFFIYEDRKERLWIGTWGGGLNLFDRKTGKFKAYKNNPNDSTSISTDYLRSIYEDSKGRIWLGTHFGLNLVVFKNETQSFPYNKGNLWMSTNKGICRFTPPSNGEKPKIRNYDVSDGLLSNEFNGNAFCKDKDGMMYFGGINGFNTFYPDSLIDNTFLPPVFITKFQIFNKSVEVSPNSTTNNSELLKNGDSYFLAQTINFTKQITLSYKENMFSFEFSSLDYSRPEKNQYAYKMEGFDSDWNYIGSRRFALYTNLPSGTYVFRIKATNSDGVWNENGTSIKLVITPPWWKTWWFSACCIVFIILSIILYIKWREQNLRKEKEILENEVSFRTIQLKSANEELNQQKEEITAQRDEIEVQNELLEEKNREVMDSIHYALRIQEAVLPSKGFIDSILKEYFIIFKPKDIVSGDFYFVAKRGKWLIISVADCTGHGVPGGFMSMLGISYLNEIIAREEVQTASHVLDELRIYIIKSLQQSGEEEEQQDGMDMVFIAIDTETNNLQFAGANNPLWIIKSPKSQDKNSKPQEIETPSNSLDLGLEALFLELKGDKMPVAIHSKLNPFTNHETRLNKGDLLYLCSDGCKDQFGGLKGKRFMSKNLKELILENYNKSMADQKAILNKTLNNWQNGQSIKYEQTDDITVFGIKI